MIERNAMGKAADGHPVSARVRRQKATDQAIAAAAVEAALELGFDRVTVEMICSAAGVSRSTFFNYYSSRDAAIIGRTIGAPTPEQTDRAMSGHPGSPVDGLLDLVVPAVASFATGPELRTARARLLAGQPAALRQYSAGLILVQNNLTEAAEAWLTAHPESARLPGRPRVEATLAVTAVYAAMQAVTGGWSIPLREVPDPLAACHCVIESLRTLVGLREPAPPGPAEILKLPVPAEEVPATGLRERKRRDTESRLELAAVRFALERGFAGVTVDEICREAVVSRSTFFNYFPAREAAIVGRPLEILTGAAAAEVLAPHGNDLPTGVFALMAASLIRGRVNPDVARLRTELALKEQAARDAGTATLVDAGEALMNVVRDWLIANPQHARLPGQPAAEAVLASNAAYAGVSVLRAGWLAVAGDPEASAATFAAAMDDLRTVLEDRAPDNTAESA
ncbi:TetR/AcrR family transcriptional regulator [Arthrobacter sp. zg-Y916]|uniref:TetR/AcrR family transcriptional regulator n=1 Tax=Arthrobacter sp. zg-Y916 TaxID=2894190 RepID=UPI002F41B481|nr:TetR/AcrR family transcriptional regulator [Arthrobacter sp. zg-Y916]